MTAPPTPFFKLPICTCHCGCGHRARGPACLSCEAGRHRKVELPRAGWSEPTSTPPVPTEVPA